MIGEIKPPPTLPNSVEDYAQKQPTQLHEETVLAQNRHTEVTALGADTTVAYNEQGQQAYYVGGKNEQAYLHTPETQREKIENAIKQLVTVTMKRILGGRWRTHEPKSSDTPVTEKSRTMTTPESEAPKDLLEKHLLISYNLLKAAFDIAQSQFEAQHPHDDREEISDYVINSIFQELQTYVTPLLDAMANHPSANHTHVRPQNSDYLSPSLTEMLTPLERDGLVIMEGVNVRLEVNRLSEVTTILTGISDQIKELASAYYDSLNGTI